ncbi:MAG: DUF5063 domain-containing protein [Muribaculaceae bacterium]|nr:DUF5063 domain-containing protein [Muribaculaceae bacterium]
MKTEDKARLYDIVALCNSYCELCQAWADMEKDEFIDRILSLLPKIYWNFFDLVPETIPLEDDYFSTYVDEDLYEFIQKGIASIIGAQDTYLDTFHEDMKYSETPITASVSEGLADIFQPLFDFISIVRDSDGDRLEDAYLDCREKFESYWSQNLCNVMKALNDIKFGRL